MDCFVASLAMTASLPRPAFGERHRPPSAAVPKNAEAKLRLRRIIRCDPGEGVQVYRWSNNAERAPHPNPLRASFARLDPARAGRGSASSVLTPHDISIFFRAVAPITSMPRVPIRCVISIAALKGAGCGRPRPFWQPTSSMAVKSGRVA